MERSLSEIIKLIKSLPAEFLNQAFDNLSAIKEIADESVDSGTVDCLYCESDHVVKNGKRRGKQAYICRNCGKTFIETSGSIIAHSHSSKTVWFEVVEDAVNGISIRKTAKRLHLSVPTVFYMRHKILRRIEESYDDNPVQLNGACETDETYVLESFKGRPVPKSAGRKARRHGSIAKKRGISNEYICVNTSITSDKNIIATSINRATPSASEIMEVYGNRINDDTIMLVDGNKVYNVLDAKCTIAVPNRINKINGFHHFIKDRLLGYAGVATIYQNRYNSLFAKSYARADNAIKEICDMITTRDKSFITIADNKMAGLLCL